MSETGTRTVVVGDDQPSASRKEQLVQVTRILAKHQCLQPLAKMGEGLLGAIMAKESLDNASSKQDVAIGLKQHPFDFESVKNFELVNVHHSRSLKTKRNATVGLGFSDEKIDTTLDPLCDISWQDTLNDATQEFWNLGTGYIETVRDKPGGKILGLHHLPTPDAQVYVENRIKERHFEIRNTTDAGGTAGVLRFARFGDSGDFIKRAKRGDTQFNVAKENVSEVITLRQPTSFSRWYGFPDWLAGTAVIEVSSMFLQYTFDFFLNRGVPEFMLFVTGQKLGKDDWKMIEDAVAANVGQGNSHKSVAVNLASKEVTVQVERLGVETGLDQGWVKFSDALDLKMVTAHGVPPLLGGIQTPGKLGANNEMANAMAAFQTLDIGPAQKIIASALATTLGRPDLNGGLGLTRENFFTTEETDDGNNDESLKKVKKTVRPTLVRITDEINVGQMDTTGRMKDEANSEEGKARDTSEGTED